MPKTNELISSADFVNLKATVKKEITRRSNSKSTGSMAAYNNASYEYTTPPAKGVQVAQEHINKITQPLDAVNGGKLTPEAGALIRAGTLDDAAVLAANLAKKSLTAAKSNTGCKASCSGLCATGCYSGCTGCSGGCARAAVLGAAGAAAAAAAVPRTVPAAAGAAPAAAAADAPPAVPAAATIPVMAAAMGTATAAAATPASRRAPVAVVEAAAGAPAAAAVIATWAAPAALWSGEVTEWRTN